MIVIHETAATASAPRKKVSLSAPWITYFNKIKAMFGKDPEIKITVDDGKNSGQPSIELLVDSQTKYEALSRLLPAEKQFGNVTALVRLVPSNASMKTQQSQIFEAAFKGNPVFVETIPIEGVLSNPVTYVSFAKEVVQFYNDNGADPHGLTSTLYQNIAKDIFEGVSGVFYCTDAGK